MNKEEKIAIIKIEGGICSQLGYFVLGKYLEDLNYTVKYDFSWFKTNGMDMNGVYVRNYDLEKAFPSFHLPAATDEEIKLYSENHNVFKNYDKFKDKMYICNYPERLSLLPQYQDFLKAAFQPIDIDSMSHIYDKIKKQTSCAVHVRRGDLAKYHPNYGNPQSPSYFIKTINAVKNWNSETKFFFFSDECEWVSENIIPILPENIEYEIISQNGSDKGYLDLWLISKCDYIIASKGSMARCAKFLSNETISLLAPKNIILNKVTK